MNVLAIGNSFSQDAMRYLHKIAAADGVDITTVNLMIGGCSLFTHYKNMLTDEKKYRLEHNGEDTGFYVSLKEALLNREWDVVTMQQVSTKSTNCETFQPYLDELSEYVKKMAPKAKQILHQTWAYEQDSDRLCKNLGYEKQEDMFNDIKASYEKAIKNKNFVDIIPSGELFQGLIAEGINKIHRDTFHASLGLGRYALGLLWYKKLMGNDITDNSFCEFDEPVSCDDIAIVKKVLRKL